MRQNEFDALVSLVFNIGGSNFSRSTMLRLINEKAEARKIGAEFLKWVYARGASFLGWSVAAWLSETYISKVRDGRLGAILILAVIARNAYLVIDEWSVGGVIWHVLMCWVGRLCSGSTYPGSSGKIFLLRAEHAWIYH
nr:glycoside hydrolase family protein [Pseudomonas aeruginosa]